MANHIAAQAGLWKRVPLKHPKVKSLWSAKFTTNGDALGGYVSMTMSRYPANEAQPELDFYVLNACRPIAGTDTNDFGLWIEANKWSHKSDQSLLYSSSGTTQVGSGAYAGYSLSEISGLTIPIILGQIVPGTSGDIFGMFKDNGDVDFTIELGGFTTYRLEDAFDIVNKSSRF